MLKAMSKFQDVLKMFILGMLKTILKTVLKYEKKHHHTLRHVKFQYVLKTVKKHVENFRMF